MAASRLKLRTARSQHKVSEKVLVDSILSEEVTVKERENPLAWKFISFSQMSDLVLLTVDLVEKALAEILQLKQYQNCMKEGILLDYYVSGFWWAKEQNFAILQISAFMTLLISFWRTSAVNKHLPMPGNLKELTKLMTEVSQSSSDKSRGVEFFTIEQAKAIINYMKISLFQHYRLYEFLFHHTPDLEILDTKLEVEVIKSADPFPSPLEESLTWDIYSSFVLQQSTEEPETEVEAETEEGTEVKDSTTEDPLACYNIDDVKSVLSQVTGEVLGNIQSEINEKLQKQEEAFTARINKLRKS
ncbi:ciliary-associated calcium-binding coiled-coil protein 1 [Pristis pectinata]|uniref:ciliary-associated calcium-binding coiled-coil protein 1 n=1 Tax=Pristis pectinata TaxID=685728 RepID=UPI00223CEB8D|nr:ciliary-associated calcium-binding coiled-coil protein 1 [Pristis pectinata]